MHCIPRSGRDGEECAVVHDGAAVVALVEDHAIISHSLRMRRWLPLTMDVVKPDAFVRPLEAHECIRAPIWLVDPQGRPTCILRSSAVIVCPGPRLRR